MQINPKRFITASVLLLALLGSTIGLAHSQEGSRLATANGDGTLKVGHEEFKITSVVVKLLDDHEAQITLVTDITVFLNGKWSAGTDAAQGIDLTITGGAASSGVDGSGKVFLSDDGKTVTKLTINGASRISKRSVAVTFVGH